MNTTSSYMPSQLAAFLPMFVFILFWSLPVWADSRQDALFELDRLHSSASASALSDELKSVDATFAVAEHYFQSNDVVQSERFYLLTIQKARIVLAGMQKISLPATQPPPATTVTTPPPDITAPAPDTSQQTITPEVVQEVDIQTPEVTADSDSNISSDRLVGSASTYTVVHGDTIRLVAAKLGVTRAHLSRILNGHAGISADMALRLAAASLRFRR